MSTENRDLFDAAVEDLSDEEVFKLAKLINEKRDEVRRSITRRAGHEVRVYIDHPPLKQLSPEELNELQDQAGRLVNRCNEIMEQREP